MQAYKATLNGIECQCIDTAYYSGLSTKEFTIYFLNNQIIGIEGVLYGDWFIETDPKTIQYYIDNYLPNIHEILKEIN